MGYNSLGAEDAKLLADALRVNGSMTSLDISNNQMGDEGVKPICEALKQNTTLKVLDLNARNVSGGEIGPQGAKYLADMLGVNASVTCVDVRRNNIAGDGASELSAAVLANTKIEVFNEIPIKEMRADALTELDLKGKGIGVEGGMVVAGLVPVMGSMTCLDVSGWNFLGEEGEATLRKAIEGRSRFELVLRVSSFWS